MKRILIHFLLAIAASAAYLFLGPVSGIPVVQPALAQESGGQDAEAMRRQLRQLGVPEPEIEKTIKALEDKMKEGGVPEGQQIYAMKLRKRPVKVHMKWTMDLKPYRESIAYRCRKQDLNLDFTCRYTVSGAAEFSGTLEYVPLKDTEKVLREMDAMTTLRVELGRISPEVRVEGGCSAEGGPQDYCGIRELARPYVKESGASLSGEAKMTDKGSRFLCTGSFQASIFGTPLLESQAAPAQQTPKQAGREIARGILKGVLTDEGPSPEPSSQGGVPMSTLMGNIRPEIGQDDYHSFMKQLLESGHYHRTFRWSDTASTSGAGEARLEAEIDVELVGGPAPAELKPGAR